jgi:hypothetical protein
VVDDLVRIKADENSVVWVHLDVVDGHLILVEAVEVVLVGVEVDENFHAIVLLGHSFSDDHEGTEVVIKGASV